MADDQYFEEKNDGPTKTDILKSEYLGVFSSKSGRAVLEDLLKFSHFYSADPSLGVGEMAYSIGMRRIILRILGMTKQDNIDSTQELFDKNVGVNNDG